MENKNKNTFMLKIKFIMIIVVCMYVSFFNIFFINFQFTQLLINWPTTVSDFLKERTILLCSISFYLQEFCEVPITIAFKVLVSSVSGFMIEMDEVISFPSYFHLWKLGAWTFTL